MLSSFVMVENSLKHRLYISRTVCGFPDLKSSWEHVFLSEKWTIFFAILISDSQIESERTESPFNQETSLFVSAKNIFWISCSITEGSLSNIVFGRPTFLDYTLSSFESPSVVGKKMFDSKSKGGSRSKYEGFSSYRSWPHRGELLQTS